MGRGRHAERFGPTRIPEDSWEKGPTKGGFGRYRRGYAARVIGTKRGIAVQVGLAIALVTFGLCTAGPSAAASPVSLHWYTAPQNGGSFQQAAAACTRASNGKYRLTVEPLPSDASQQREQLVRRLAAEDGDIDLISMDVN